jgi:hypothetical protein
MHAKFEEGAACGGEEAEEDGTVRRCFRQSARVLVAAKSAFSTLPSGMRKAMAAELPATTTSHAHVSRLPRWRIEKNKIKK